MWSNDSKYMYTSIIETPKEKETISTILTIVEIWPLRDIVCRKNGGNPTFFDNKYLDSHLGFLSDSVFFLIYVYSRCVDLSVLILEIYIFLISILVPVQLLVFVNKRLIDKIAVIYGCLLLLTTVLCAIILVWLGPHIVVPGSPFIIPTSCCQIHICPSLCCWQWLVRSWSWLLSSRSRRSGWSRCCNWLLSSRPSGWSGWLLSSRCWCWRICWWYLISPLVDSEDLL